MRVSQRFAGYSLAEADNLRKACGKKNRELMAEERVKFVEGCDAQRLRRRPRHVPVRHHRGLRRLRLQQEPQLRLRAGHLPDRLPEGPPPGRVPGRAPDQRQDEPRQGGGLPQRVPHHGHRGAGARRQQVRVRLRARHRRRGARRHPLRPVGGPQRRRRPGRAHRRRAARARRLRRLLRLLRPGRHDGAQQAHRRVADQGRRLRLPRPPPQGPAVGVRGRSSTPPCPAVARPTPAS